jgi:single-stranded-DNA-specific exonuclease
LNKQWKVYNADEKQVEKIAKEFNINKLVARIIANKDFKNKEQIEVFLNPKRNDFYDPFLMPDMEKAVTRIIKAIDNNEKTIIYGDYDVDGITSSTVLKRYLEERGLCADVYIPNRLDEGYGLNENAINEISEKKYELIITVDCGITGNKEVELAKKSNVDVIITDHHETSEEIPKAVAVVDAKRKDNKYPFKGLAGVGVTFKLIQAISKKMQLQEETYLKYLDLVCVGTISDIVPLEDENRVISKLGLQLVKQTRNIGLRTLLNIIGYKDIDSNAISFGVAPRINACGRMGHEKDALDLFLTNDIEEAKKITELLVEYNQERQEIEKKIFCEAIDLIDNNETNCIIVGKEQWHHGVIGIVSSKITEIYDKPSILLCYEDGIAKGSGRSIKGFDLHEAIENCSTYVEQFGGHSMAIGITLKEENVEKFKKEFEEYIELKDIKSIVPIIPIDAKVDLKDLTIDDIKEFKVLEPYGEGNKRPLFQISNIKIISIRTLSDGKHLKMLLKDDNNKFIDTIGFNMGYLADNFSIGTKIDVVGNLEVNEYNENKKIQLNIKDIRNAI